MTRLQALRDQLEKTLLECLKTTIECIKTKSATLEIDAESTQSAETENDYVIPSSSPTTPEYIVQVLESLVKDSKEPHQPLYRYLLDHLIQLNRFLYRDIVIQQQSFLDNPKENELFLLSKTAQMRLCALFSHLKQILALYSTDATTLVCDEKTYTIKGLKGGWVTSAPSERNPIKQLFIGCNLDYHTVTEAEINSVICPIFQAHHYDALQCLTAQLEKKNTEIQQERRLLMIANWNTLESSAYECHHFFSSEFLSLYNVPDDEAIQDETLKSLYNQYHRARSNQQVSELKLRQQKEKLETLQNDAQSIKRPTQTAPQAQPLGNEEHQEPIVIRLLNQASHLTHWALQAVSAYAQPLTTENQYDTHTDAINNEINDTEKSSDNNFYTGL